MTGGALAGGDRRQAALRPLRGVEPVACDDNRPYDALIFDLDGTLWDAAAASTYGWNLALQEMGLA